MDKVSYQKRTWISDLNLIKTKSFSHGMWNTLYVTIARNRSWTILILLAQMMENHIVNIIITNFLAIHVHGADALFNPRLFERLKLTVRGVPINWPVIQVIAAFEKRWCAECFQCYTCNKAISPREKFIEYDMKPICKKCFGTGLRSIIF